MSPTCRADLSCSASWPCQGSSQSKEVMPSGATQGGSEVASELEVMGKAAGTAARCPGAVRACLREPVCPG